MTPLGNGDDCHCPHLAEEFKGQRLIVTQSWGVVALELTLADLSLTTGILVTLFYHLFSLKTSHTGIFI